MAKRRCEGCNYWNGHEPGCPMEAAAKEETRKLFGKLGKQGYSRVQTVNDLLPDGHHLKGKSLPKSEAFFQAALNGETSGGMRPRSVPELDHPFKPPTMKLDYTHFCDPETNRTLCGIDMLTSWIRDEGGTWREGTSSEMSAKPCPDCIRKKMETDDDDEAGSGESFSQSESFT